MLSGVASAPSGFVPAAMSAVGGQGQSGAAQLSQAATAKGGLSQSGQLSLDDQRRVAELKKTDREVRQHEQAHMAVGADLITSGPSYEYEKGPDGARYAVAGEVGIDTSKADKPEDTLAKAKHIRQTALAPANPSDQDRRVAALASQMEMSALQEIARNKQQEAQGSTEGSSQGNQDRQGNVAVALSAYRDMSGKRGAGLGASQSGAGVSAYA